LAEKGHIVDLRERAGGDLRHPWELARSTFFRRLVADQVVLPRISSVLDIGAGDGWFAHQLLQDLRADVKVVCWDVNYRSQELATPLGGSIERTADAPEGEFPLVLLLDVLEHVIDDEALLIDTVLPHLSPGGILIASVPAYPSLFSEHDRMLRHERRYHPRKFLQLLSRHLEMIGNGPLFTSLLLPRAASVLLENAGRFREARGVGDWGWGPGITAALTNMLLVDARVGVALSRHGVRLPGLSCWAVARRAAS
jgi:SAM-dependent methyltransferase